jgi:hypothetical protein
MICTSPRASAASKMRCTAALDVAFECVLPLTPVTSGDVACLDAGEHNGSITNYSD